jgi:hypothetical protein
MRDTKARETQGNYCPECKFGKGEKGEQITYRISKKLYAQRLRGLKRRARQLATEGVALADIIAQLTPDAGRIKLDAKRVQDWIVGS